MITRSPGPEIVISLRPCGGALESCHLGRFGLMTIELLLAVRVTLEIVEAGSDVSVSIISVVDETAADETAADEYNVPTMCHSP